ncbi:unnamed protein product [Ophioblennius macclurei]
MESTFVLFLLLMKTCWDPLRALQPDGLHFAVLADWGGMPVPPYYTPHEEAVAAVLDGLAQSQGIHFVLSLGDHFYFSGVRSVDDPRFKHTFEGVFAQSSLLDIPWYLTGGNHDHRGNISAQMAYSRVSKRWNYPDLYYDLQFTVPQTNTSVSVLMIDTVVLCGNTYDHLQPSGPDNARAADQQWAWINTKLSSSRSDYLLVAGHFPVWSIGNHGPTSCLVKKLRPLLKKYKVSAYLSGHDHDLQFIREDDGSSYVVSGSGVVSDPTMRHQDSIPRSWQLYSSPVNRSVGGLAYFQVTDQLMTVSFMQTDLTCAYRAEIPRR